MISLQRGRAWLAQCLEQWVRQLLAAALASHAVPKHIAIVMDGNRRWSEQQQMRKIEGHSFGYRKLIDVLEWCLELGVTCVSVYAFSIDNYKRSAEEVDTLMALAEEKLAHMLQEHDVLVRHGVAVRVTGDLGLAPPRVQAAAQRVMEATRHHSRAVLNICFSYTASEELLQALDACSSRGGSCDTSSSSSSSNKRMDASADGDTASTSGRQGSGSAPAPLAALESRLYTAGCPPVDLLIRTSGETRLSDFLLWQARHALLVFTSVLWPDFTFLDLVAAILQFQSDAETLQRLREATAAQEPAALKAAAAATAAAALRAAAQPCCPAQQPEAAVAQGGSIDASLDTDGQLRVLHAVKARLLLSEAQQQASGSESPRAVASPDDPPSSPSSRSDGSADNLAVAASPAVCAADPAAAAPLQLRLRRQALPVA